MMIDFEPILLFKLLVAFQVKHFLSDYPLQGKYMLQKGLAGWGFFVPLLSHSLVHAVGTLAIILWINPSMAWLAGVDLLIHFFMDRIKSGPKYLGRFHDETKASFWNCFGFDQMVHHLTHYGIIFILLFKS